MLVGTILFKLFSPSSTVLNIIPFHFKGTKRKIKTRVLMRETLMKIGEQTQNWLYPVGSWIRRINGFVWE